MNQDYIEFVQEKIKEMKSTARLIREGQVIPARLNTCLAQYTEVNLMLVAEYQNQKTEHKRLEELFQLWWDKKFIASRNLLNEDRAKTKFASKAEIDSQTRIDNEKEYVEKKRELSESESRVRFMLRLIDSWKSQKDILVNLSQNMRTEMKALYVEDWANKAQKVRDETSIQPRRKRKVRE